jgi:hypothetical protein
VPSTVGTIEGVDLPCSKACRPGPIGQLPLGARVAGPPIRSRTALGQIDEP